MLLDVLRSILFLNSVLEFKWVHLKQTKPNLLVAVLGIVELGVHIMQQYYEYDKDKKAVFADVHFLLFYTDIFNALQAVIQAYVTRRYSTKLWVKTEELELDHYVTIREEYDSIHNALYPPNSSSSSLLPFFQRVRLQSKHSKLLMIIKFHELRVNFLDSYNLPMGLPISDYLMRSEKCVMISLAHVSPVAWLWLTAVCNGLYYFAGLVTELTEDPTSSVRFYSIFFFVSMFVLILISFALDLNMQHIFLKIM